MRNDTIASSATRATTAITLDVNAEETADTDMDIQLDEVLPALRMCGPFLLLWTVPVIAIRNCFLTNSYD